MPDYYAANFDIRQELNAGAVEGEKNYKAESEIHEAIITRAARRATNTIDAKLKKSFPSEIPFAASGDVPWPIREIANDLGVYYVRRAKHPGPGPMADNLKKEYFEEPMELLAVIVENGIPLSDLETQTTNKTEVYHTNEGYVPIFDVDPAENQFADPDRLEDIEDSKDK